MPKVKVGINGFGRIGRLTFRQLFDADVVELVHVNEPSGGNVCAAHLLEFDTVQGRWDRSISAGPSGASFSLGAHAVAFTAHADPAAIPWAASGAEIVLECSGQFVQTTDSVEGHFASASVRKVLVSAPVKKPGRRGDALNIVFGVNESLYDAGVHDVVTAASCTTNCLAPVVSVLLKTVGLEHGLMTTIHDATNTQVVVDRPHKDLRRARASMSALVPTTTGSATAVIKIFPELEGRLDGMAVRVPLLTGSLCDFVFTPARETTVEEVNAVLKAAAEEGDLKGILGYEGRPLVSTDFCGDERSGVVDALSTMSVGDKLFKVLIWYDNEAGYSARMKDICHMLAASN